MFVCFPFLRKIAYSTGVISYTFCIALCCMAYHVIHVHICSHTTVNGTEALIERGFETSTAWLWYDQIILACITIVCLIITYINLRMVKKHR